MPGSATVVPEQSDLLCEGCGYTLNGLPLSGNCPECGKPIEESIGGHRGFSPFESAPSLTSFLRTTGGVIFHPRRFYGHLIARESRPALTLFSRIHLGIASVLFAIAATGHYLWVVENLGLLRRPLRAVAVLAVAVPTTALLLVGLTALATWLSALEAKYWGMRLPYAVVKRGLTFHRAAYLPVGLIAVGVVWAYQLAIASRAPGFVDRQLDTYYLYTLCALVVLCAVYLFQAYWIAMRSLMYANR
jgi:hypothetical protein